MKDFYQAHFQQYKALAFNGKIYKNLDNFISVVLKVRSEDGKIIFAGNGASAAISAHAAVDFTKQVGIRGITFTGRDENNSLKLAGDLNFWVDSHAYNIVECIHMIWLTTAIDRILGNAIYEVSSLD